ncbi:PrgI family protein [Peptoniphilus asaccharolyticus]|uniref:PrgI family protein n=1 Tax=Peptoniphilus asaccharolyticus TaxID=1258 RepID=UPI000A021498|nr:PrgI family protein [Peptoniphilus asaccharolyticus]MBL7576438.1 PrgI family protein [Peptoniphilus asaccharolyticus]
MIEIRIPKEITSYKEKLVFGLTVRQFITTTIALAINIPLYIYGRDYIGDEAMSWIIILTTLPLASIGFFKYNGMTFEKFLYVLFQYMVYPQKRTYQIKSFWVTFDTNYEKLMNMAYEIDNGKREYRKRVKSEKKKKS